MGTLTFLVHLPVSIVRHLLYIPIYMYDPAMCEQPGKICSNPYNLRVLSKQNKQTKPNNNPVVSIHLKRCLQLNQTEQMISSFKSCKTGNLD